LPVIGLFSALLAHVGYLVLGRGNALSGTEGLVRAWAALLLPVVVIAVVIFWALARERRAIRTQLADEVNAGTVTSDDLALLGNAVRRELAYMKLRLGFKLGALSSLKALHNRQVQLAFTKDQAARESDPERRSRLDAEIGKLRSAIVGAARCPMNGIARNAGSRSRLARRSAATAAHPCSGRTRSRLRGLRRRSSACAAARGLSSRAASWLRWSTAGTTAWLWRPATRATAGLRRATRPTAWIRRSAASAAAGFRRAATRAAAGLRRAGIPGANAAAATASFGRWRCGEDSGRLRRRGLSRDRARRRRRDRSESSCS
jgi:hypothetical protein